MTKLILTRHGQSVWNAENRFTGWVDVDLSEKGILEAEKSGQIIKDLNIKIDISYTSYLKRAIKTLTSILKKYKCGQEATNALKKKIGRKPVTCKVQDKLDRYKRYIGVCFLGEIDLNKWMVRSGYAVAYKRYSKNYVGDEKYAKENKLGIWKGSFDRPEKWRKLN